MLIINYFATFQMLTCAAHQSALHVDDVTQCSSIYLYGLEPLRERVIAVQQGFLGHKKTECKVITTMNVAHLPIYPLKHHSVPTPWA